LLSADWQLTEGVKQFYNVNISIRAVDNASAIAVLSSVTSDLRLVITAVNGRIDRNGDAIVEASISLTDIGEIDLVIKKMMTDKRIHEVFRHTSF
jgi:(p)ppGpp synthase/HD superfamily hydrolase